MKIVWDRRTDLPTFKFEDDDLMKSIWIEEMINGKFHCRKCGTDFENNGWQALLGYMECEKMLLEAKMESGIAPNKMIAEEKSQVQIAKWSMFKHLMDLPLRIIAQAKLFRDKTKNESEVRNAARYDDEE